MTVALVAVEDVLFEVDTIRGRHPIAAAVRLVGALTTGYKVVLCSTESSEKALEHALQVNGLIQGRHFDQVVVTRPEWYDLHDHEVRLAQFRMVSADRGQVGLYVDSDPEACALVMGAGCNVLLWNRARDTRPEFRPERTRPKPWSALAEEAERQVELRTADERLKAQHEQSEFSTP